MSERDMGVAMMDMIEMDRDDRDDVSFETHLVCFVFLGSLKTGKAICRPQTWALCLP